MMKSSGSIFAVCVVVLAGTAFDSSADPMANLAGIEELVPNLTDLQVAELFETGELLRVIDPEEGPALVPGREFSQPIAADLQAIEYTIGVEVLNIIPKESEGLSIAAAANLLLELSTLEGLEYFSASRKKMHTLFVQSYVIDGPESEGRIDDPRVAEIPATGSVTLFQQDKTFGKNKLTLTYEVTSSTIHMVTENITRFSWGLIPLIKPQRLRMHVLIHMTDDCILYYANFGAKALRFSLFENRIHDSFYNRLVALYGWFEQKLPLN
jgi:hypothetical protein